MQYIFLGLFLFLVLLVMISFLESLLSYYWNPFYFRTGLTVFRREIYLGNKISKLHIKIQELGHQFPRSFWSRAVIFKAISKTECAFREEFYWFSLSRRSNSLIMRGIIIIDTTSKSVIIKGKVTWTYSVMLFCFSIFLICLLISVLVSLFMAQKIIEIGYFLIVFLPLLAIIYFVFWGLYFVDKTHFKKVTKVLESSIYDAFN